MVPLSTVPGIQHNASSKGSYSLRDRSHCSIHNPWGFLFQALKQLSSCPVGFDLSCWSIWKEISDAAGNNFMGDSEVMATARPQLPPLLTTLLCLSA